MTDLVREIGNVDHNGRVGAFRNWLRTTTVNLARNYLRHNSPARGTGLSEVHQMLSQLEDPRTALSQQFDLEHDRTVIRALLDRVSRQFEPATIDMFQLHVVEDCPADEAARRLGVSVASVHTAKSRVLRRLRQEATDWIDDICN